MPKVRPLNPQSLSQALLTQLSHQATGERQRAPPSAPSAPRTPTQPLGAAKRPPTAPPSEHTHLDPPCRRAAAPSKPNFHPPHYDTTSLASVSEPFPFYPFNPCSRLLHASLHPLPRTLHYISRYNPQKSPVFVLFLVLFLVESLLSIKFV